MAKYILKRLLRGLLSVVAVVVIVMALVYTFMDRELVFSSDPLFIKRENNDRELYKYTQWEQYGYLDCVQYSDYLSRLEKDGEITQEIRQEAVGIGRYEENDTPIVREYVQKFENDYKKKGYTVTRLDPVWLIEGKRLANGGKQQLFAYKDTPLVARFFAFFKDLIKVDNIHFVKEDIGERGITFTLFDPVYNTSESTGELVKVKFSPAIMGRGTKHKYLLYFDSRFPYVHQNLITVNLGVSYAVNRNVDVFDTMNAPQGGYEKKPIVYPTGLKEESSDDLHTATYAYLGAKDASPLFQERFLDDYTNLSAFKRNNSKLGYSFVIGVIASILSYAIALPVGILMARKKDKIFDKLFTAYIIFILAVPSLAYIFMFKAIGAKLGLPSSFDMERENWQMYLLPILSLALPSAAGLMKWLRRYMIDQMNADYVKFVRSGGLGEGEIFKKHVLKNAVIPIAHGVPSSLLGALVGAIITERVYLVPGAGNMLTQAINFYDNSVIVGLTLFYATLSILAVLLGDILMASIDPRISFQDKGR